MNQASLALLVLLAGSKRPQLSPAELRLLEQLDSAGGRLASPELQRRRVAWREVMSCIDRGLVEYDDLVDDLVLTPAGAEHLHPPE